MIQFIFVLVCNSFDTPQNESEKNDEERKSVIAACRSLD